MISLWQDFFIKLVFEHILVRSNICLECLTYVPPLAKTLLIHSPHLEKLLLYHFYFNFMLFVHTGHADFAFNQCSIFTEYCFQLLKKVKMVKFTPILFRFPTLKKKTQQNFSFLPLSDLPHPLTLLENSACCIKSECHEKK